MRAPSATGRVAAELDRRQVDLRERLPRHLKAELAATLDLSPQTISTALNLLREQRGMQAQTRATEAELLARHPPSTAPPPGVGDWAHINALLLIERVDVAAGLAYVRWEGRLIGVPHIACRAPQAPEVGE